MQTYTRPAWQTVMHQKGLLQTGIVHSGSLHFEVSHHIWCCWDQWRSDELSHQQQGKCCRNVQHGPCENSNCRSLLVRMYLRVAKWFAAAGCMSQRLAAAIRGQMLQKMPDETLSKKARYIASRQCSCRSCCMMNAARFIISLPSCSLFLQQHVGLNIQQSSASKPCRALDCMALHPAGAEAASPQSGAWQGSG